MYATLLCTSYRFPKICKQLVVCRFYCMALYHSQIQYHMINQGLALEGLNSSAVQVLVNKDHKFIESVLK